MDKEKLKRLSRMIDELDRELSEKQRNTEILKRALAEIKRKHGSHIQSDIDQKTKASITALAMSICLRAQNNGKVRAGELRKKLQISDSPKSKKLSRVSLVSNRRNRVML